MTNDNKSNKRLVRRAKLPEDEQTKVRISKELNALCKAEAAALGCTKEYIIECKLRTPMDVCIVEPFNDGERYVTFTPAAEVDELLNRRIEYTVGDEVHDTDGAA